MTEPRIVSRIARSVFGHCTGEEGYHNNTPCQVVPKSVPWGMEMCCAADIVAALR